MRVRHAGFSANARLKLPLLTQCHRLHSPARQPSPFVKSRSAIEVTIADFEKQSYSHVH